METIIAAVISGVVALVVCVITQVISSSRTRALIEYRIDELTRKVEKHNQLIDRTYELEKESEVTAQKVKSLTYRVNDLERTHK